MISLKRWHNCLFFIFLALIVVILIFVSNTLSISYKESLTYFNDTNLLNALAHFSTAVFGNNNIALRLPFIAFYALSSLLIYTITKDYFRNEKDRLISAFLFMILPGVISSSLLVNNAVIVMFCILLYLYYYKTYKVHNYFLLILFLFIDNSFAILYLSLFFYALQKKENWLLSISLILFGISMYIYGFDSGGKPKGHFLDTLTIYASIFSPLIFLYYVYAMYRIGIKSTKTIYWYISIVALLFSLIFSFRQRVLIEDFAPFVVITFPLMMKYFFHTLRIRLPQFRHKHYIISYMALFLLIMSVMVILFNKPLYLLLKNPEDHFAYKYHFADEISMQLKQHNINYIESDDYQLENRLKFYGIKTGDKYLITISKPEKYFLELPFFVLNKKVFNLYVIDSSKY